MSLFNNIPLEMRVYKQWVCWRLELRPGAKNTKVPYCPWPSGGMASVTNAATWGTFEQACAAPLHCSEAVDSSVPVSETGFTGIGFVLTLADPYCFGDLDDTHGDKEAYETQVRIFNKFETYCEYSPSGSGCHIIAKGTIPHGRRRSGIELYANERYMTMTGNVIKDLPINDCQPFIDVLYNQLGGEVKNYAIAEDKEERQSDEEIIASASAAQNGEKFKQLFVGEWQSLYGSQSEGDFALVDIIAFYTQNKAQIARIFRSSQLGQRDKAKRDRYIEYMVEKSFDRQLPPIDMEGFKNAFSEAMAAKDAAAGNALPTTEPGRLLEGNNHASTAAPASGQNAGAGISHAYAPAVNPFPPGLLGEVAAFILAAAPRPVPEIALAGAIGFLAGITGRAYNISGAGLNQYILFLAPTGVGKDAVSDGISSLMNHVQATVPSIIDFKGPGELVSSAGLIKWLEKKPCVVSILGEFGKKMKEMAAPNANSHLHGLSRVLLQMFSKSGAKGVFDPMAYSDKDKNTAPLFRPSLTIIGESVPEQFYEALDESLIADGLLPRFMVFEYKGERSYYNKNSQAVMPSFSLIQRIGDVAAQSLSLQNKQTVHDVDVEADVAIKFDEFDVWTTDQINNSKSEVHKQLWNRAHLKAMKLAALQAVGENYLHPVVTMPICLWATNMIVEQVTKLIAKFDTGMIGQVGGSENRQLRDIVKVIGGYYQNPHDKFAKYGGSFEMHRQGVITESHISRRVSCMASFRHDRLGPTAAIKRTLETLIRADELREMPKAQMIENFGTGPRAFVVSDASRFLEKED